MANLTKAEREALRITHSIVDAFRNGNVAEPLALNILPRATDRPIDRWSISNRFGCYLMGCTDARTYNQWRQVGRHVVKGNHASAYIIMACLYPEDKDDPDSKQVLKGFRYQDVYDISVTDGEPVAPVEAQQFIEALPLLQVAEHWGMRVFATDTVAVGAAGMFMPRANVIELGVSNLSTWFHELVHKAEDLLGTLDHDGPKWEREIVAELGGAVLAHMVGIPEAADEGGCWSYVQRYAKDAKIDPARACLRVIDRLGKAVTLIIETADQLAVGS